MKPEPENPLDLRKDYVANTSIALERGLIYRHMDPEIC